MVLFNGLQAVTIELMATAIGLVATIITTTVVVVSKLTRLEVMIAELRGTMAGFEHRINELERLRR